MLHTVVAKRSSIEDFVLMRTILLKWSSFGPHSTQKASFSSLYIIFGKSYCGLFPEFMTKEPFIMAKICNINFWIGNDPPPLRNFSENSSVLVGTSFPYSPLFRRAPLIGSRDPMRRQTSNQLWNSAVLAAVAGARLRHARMC